MEEIERALPGLKFGAEEDDFFVWFESEFPARFVAIDGVGLGEPPIVVDGVERHGDAIGFEAERDHHVAAGGRGGEDLASEAENGGPDEFFCGEFKLAGVAGLNAGGVGAEDEGDAFGASGGIGDPESSARVADVGDHGVEIILADEIPEAGVAPGEEAFGAIAAIGDVGPFVAVEEGDVPLDVGAEFGVVGG